MNYNLFGDKYIEVPNEPDALVVNYYLNEDAASGARVTLADRAGRVLRDVQGPSRRGLNRVTIPLGGGGQRGRGAGGAAPSGPLEPGDYVVTLRVSSLSGPGYTDAARVRDRIR